MTKFKVWCSDGFGTEESAAEIEADTPEAAAILWAHSDYAHNNGLLQYDEDTAIVNVKNSDNIEYSFSVGASMIYQIDERLF